MQERGRSEAGASSRAPTVGRDASSTVRTDRAMSDSAAVGASSFGSSAVKLPARMRSVSAGIVAAVKAGVPLSNSTRTQPAAHTSDGYAYGRPEARRGTNAQNCAYRIARNCAELRRICAARTLAALGRDVARRPDLGHRQPVGRVEHARHAEVAELDVLVVEEEDVLQRDVAVEHL